MHTLEDLRGFLGGYMWCDFVSRKNGKPRSNGNPKIIKGIIYTVIIGPHLGRPAVACVAEGKFVAIAHFVLPINCAALDPSIHPPVSPVVKGHFIVEGGWGEWHVKGTFDHTALIIRNDCYALT